MNKDIQLDSNLSKTLMITGFLGLLGTLIVGTGEFMLHYSSEGYQSDLTFGFYQYVAEYRLVPGSYLAVLGIPLYFVGYFHIYQALRPGSKMGAIIVLVLGVFSFTVGGVWVGSRGFLGALYHIVVDQHQNLEMYEQIVTKYELIVENLVQILRVLVLLVSAGYVFTILKYNTLYPKWVAIFNPISLLLIVFALFFYVPVIGNYLIPTAMNVAHFIMFSVSVYALKTIKK